MSVRIGLAMSFASVMKIIVTGGATSGTSSPVTLFRIVVRRWQKQMARLLTRIGLSVTTSAVLVRSGAQSTVFL
jgi:hypothetical protein